MSWPPDLDIFALSKPLIKAEEGYSAKPYLCPAQKWTIGWGSTRYPDGRKVTMDDKPIDESFANLCLVSAMVRVRADLEVLPQFKAKPPRVNEAAALLSLAYNVGIGVHDGIKGDLADSDLLKLYAQGDLRGCADAFLDWNHAHVNGKLVELAGLTTRRQKERELFLK